MALTGLVAANNLGDVVDIEKTWDNIGNNISATVFVPSPTLDLNFASNKSLVDNVSGQNLVTFSRASTGTFVGSNGLIQTAASGVPRFDHNPATGESLGLLVEAAKTNSMWPSIISAGTWSYTNITPTYNATTAPDGTNTATLLTPNPVLSGSRARRDGIAHPTGPGMISFYAKSNGLGWVGIASGLGIDFGYSRAAYNILTGATNVSGPNPSGYSFNSAVSVGNGWWRIFINYYGSQLYGYLPGGDHCFIGVTANPEGDIVNANTTPNGIAGMYVWGVQFELGTFATSYIPTTSATVTRAADQVSITGSNFSSWYNQGSSTVSIQTRNINSFDYSQAPFIGFNGSGSIWDGAQEWGARYNSAANTFELMVTDSAGSNGFNIGGDLRSSAKVAIGLDANLLTATAGGSIIRQARANRTMPSINSLVFQYSNTDPRQSTRFSRFTYYPIRVNDITLQALATSGPVSNFSYSFSIKGRDILALKEVNKTSTRDFIFTKGLLSKAQPRLTTASQYTSSGVALRDAAMPKFAPVTRGNYFFSSGLTLSGATVQINGTNALSIATSPFSSSTATVPLLFAGLRPQTNWRISEAMASGVVVSPESAIPIATGDFLLFMKAGQS
jgi:hypothetical protein